MRSNTIHTKNTILLPQLFLVSLLLFTLSFSIKVKKLHSVHFVHSFTINNHVQSQGHRTLLVHNSFIFSLLSSQQEEQDEKNNSCGINSNHKQQSQTYTIHVKHENKISKLTIHETETILQALERNQNDNRHNQKHSDDASMMLLSSLPTLPQECRKGNCLTCSAVHLPNSNQDSVVTIDDGLSPFVKRKVNKKGYVQTCSSYVRGDDVWLELDVCNDVWNFIWNLGDGKNGLSRSNDDCSCDENGERIRNEAMAKCIRMADERNLMRWVQKTERMLD